MLFKNFYLNKLLDIFYIKYKILLPILDNEDIDLLISNLKKRNIFKIITKAFSFYLYFYINYFTYGLLLLIALTVIL